MHQKEKKTWDEELEDEYNNCMEIMQTRIKLSPYDPSKKLRLIIDRAKKVSTGYVLCQYLDEENASKGVKIVYCGSGKLDPEKDYSPIEAEAIALSRAMEAWHHWLYYSDPVQLYSDCKGLLDLFEKPLANIEN